MSNIANQLVAVGATLLGFVAHETLSDRSAPALFVPVVDHASTSGVNRSIDLNSVSTDWMGNSPRPERVAQPYPRVPLTGRTAAARSLAFHVSSEFAGMRMVRTRPAPDNQLYDAASLR